MYGGVTTPEKNQTIRILLVEDERAVLTAMKKFFVEEGFDVDCASEREEAEALIATTRYALVIADLRLSWSGAMEGLEIVRFIRQICPDTRMVVLTANFASDLQRRAKALGADAFLHKPLPLPLVAATVRRLTEGR
jgi:CheY-like chemotaxis protein